jgi:hypothetical protein
MSQPISPEAVAAIGGCHRRLVWAGENYLADYDVSSALNNNGRY